jgi:hypothetical protein
MNTPSRRILLAIALLLALDAGVWAAFLPRSFYDAFPGFGLRFVAIDGPYNEHLIRDVGAFYLALGVVTAIAVVARTALPGRLAGVGWAVFGVLHFGYHVTHPEGSGADFAAEMVALVVSAGLGIVLALPVASGSPRTRVAPRETEGAR